MDIVDLKILELLKDNSRMSFNEISKSVGKTEATVRRRVKKLTDDGVIRKFTIDYAVDNKPRTRATVKVEPDFKEIKRILKELLEIEEKYGFDAAVEYPYQRVKEIHRESDITIINLEGTFTNSDSKYPKNIIKKEIRN